MNVARFDVVFPRSSLACRVRFVPFVRSAQPAVATLAGRVVDTQLAADAWRISDGALARDVQHVDGDE